MISVTNHTYPSQEKAKLVYKDDSGRALYAGGLLLYDDVGIYLLKEYVFNKLFDYEYTDPGGKYDFRDLHIARTIYREFHEETYDAYNIDYQKIRKLYDKPQNKIFVCFNKDKNPTYVCLLASLEELDIKIDLEKFQEARDEGLKHNPLVPKEYYSSYEFVRIPYKEISRYYDNLFSYRLKQICQKSFLKMYIIK